MAYINDYNEEIDYEISGQVLSDPSVTKTIYVRAFKTGDKRYWVHRGDPVVMATTDAGLPGHDTMMDGAVVAFDGAISYRESEITCIVGIAIAEPHTRDGEDYSDPFPVVVAGDVIANVFGTVIRTRGTAPGHFYAGEYIAADGTPSTCEEWYIGRKLVLGQILAPKTDLGSTFIETRLYSRYKGGVKNYYHIPIRLTLGGVIPSLSGGSDKNHEIEAANGERFDIPANTPVSVARGTNSSGDWVWVVMIPDEGMLANGLTRNHINAGASGRVLVVGRVRYTHNDILNIISSSPRARLSSFGARILSAHLRNDDDDDPTAGYFVGMRVTDDLMPIETLVPGNQYGRVDEIDSENGEIYVSLDAVSTRAPASTASAVLETEDINEDTPVGIALIENPITKKLMRCRFATDNVDGVLQEAVQLPEVYGWSLRDYRALYGDSVFMTPDGGFWSAVKSFAKGVYKRVIKPVAKWAISVVAPVAASYVGPLGEVLASQVSTKCGQLLEAVTPSQLNGAHSCTSIFGGRSNEDMIEVYTDNSASYSDSHPNDTYVYEIDEPTANDWVIGDCLTVSADSGKAVKVDAYDTPIDAVVNFEPAQDPETNGWKIAGIARGHTEIRSNTLKVGKPVLYDGTDASTRLAAGQATAIIGRVKEVWQPSAETIAAVRAGRLPTNEELPNCIVEVAPEFHPATSSAVEKIATVYFEGVPEE